MNAKLWIGLGLSALVGMSSGAQISKNIAIPDLSDSIDEQRLLLKSELVISEALLWSLNEGKTLNDAIGLNGTNSKIRYIALPSAVGLLALDASAYWAGNKIINAVTPSRAYAKNWREEKAKHKADVKEARRDLKAFRKNEATAAASAPEAAAGAAVEAPAGVNPKVSNLELENRLLKAEAALRAHIDNPPGTLYRLGRRLRILSKTGLVLGTVGVGVLITHQATILTLGNENVEDIKAKLADNIKELKSMLGEKNPASEETI